MAQEECHETISTSASLGDFTGGLSDQFFEVVAEVAGALGRRFEPIAQLFVVDLRVELHTDARSRRERERERRAALPH